MGSVRLAGLGKTYAGGVEAVRGVDVDIADGEFVVIVGPSGCGKSTLLRLVAGLERASFGEIHIDEARVDQLEPRARDIAMVFQNYALYPHMSVFQNMAYGLKNRGDARAEIERKVRETAAMLGLDALLTRKPRQLSGGQRQRVAMGRAIVRRPKVFLFDEPLSNLDAKLRAQMRVEIKKLQRALGVTAIYVTHDQVEAMTLADRLIAMNNGRVEQIGPPLALYDRPESLFVAGFIGAPPMNLFDAESPAGQRLAAALATALGPAAARVRRLGVRPEALTPAPPGAGVLSGRVELCEPLGAETLAHVALTPSGAAIMRLAAPLAPQEGDSIDLAAAPSAIAAFDAEGARIETAAAPVAAQ